MPQQDGTTFSQAQPGRASSNGYKPLTSDELSQLDAYVAAATPDDSKFVEYEPSGPESLLWRMHPRLKWTRDWAYFRGTSPIGLLMCNIARMASVIAPEFRIGDLGKGTMTFDIGVSLYGGTGAGKSTCWKASKEMLVIEPGILQVSELTKQGLRDYCGVYEPHDGSTRRIGYNTLVWLDEGESLNKLDQRAGDSFMSTLRSLTHGNSSIIGNLTAGSGLVVIEDQTVRFAMVFGTQSAHIGALFTDGKVNDGTSQRYYFADMSKSFASHPEEEKKLSPIVITDLLPSSLLPPGLDARGMFIIPGHAMQSVFASRPAVKYSTVPSSCLKLIGQHERSLKSGVTLESRSHWGIHTAKLAHFLSMYCDGSLDPTDYHVKMAVVLMSVLDETVKLIERDISASEKADSIRTGRKRAITKVAENDTITEIQDRRTRSAYEFIMKKLKEAGAEGCNVADLLYRSGGQKARNAAIAIAQDHGEIVGTTCMSTATPPKAFRKYTLAEYVDNIANVG